MRDGWLPPLSAAKTAGKPIDNRPQLTKLPHKRAAQIQAAMLVAKAQHSIVPDPGTRSRFGYCITGISAPLLQHRYFITERYAAHGPTSSLYLFAITRLICSK